MWPDIFGLEFPRTFGLVVMLGALGAIWLTSKRAARLGYDKDRVWDFAVAVVLAGIVGARLTDIAFQWENYASDNSTWEMILAWIKIWTGQMNFVGGVVLAGVTGLAVARMWGLPLGAWLDLLAPGFALALGATAFANFCQGTYSGLPTDLAWGVSFPNECQAYVATVVPVKEGDPLHPLQLYHAFGYVFIYFWLSARLPATRAGSLFCDFLLSAGALVFICDFWRGDREPVTWLSYTLQESQFYGVALVITGIFCKFVLRQAEGGLSDN